MTPYIVYQEPVVLKPLLVEERQAIRLIGKMLLERTLAMGYRSATWPREYIMR